MPIISFRPSHLPEHIDYMIIESLSVKVGDEISVGDSIGIVNTNLGKRVVHSELAGTVCDPLPIIGERLCHDDADLLTLDVTSAPDPEKSLFSYLKLGEKREEKETTTEKVNPDKNETKRDFLWITPLLVGSSGGLIVSYLMSKPEVHYFFIGAMLLVSTLVYSINRESFKHGVMAALIFTFGFFMAPQVSILNEYSNDLGDTVSGYYYDYESSKQEEKKAETEAEYLRATARIQDQEIKDINSIKTENFRWDQDKWHDDYGKIDFVVINNSDNPLLSLEVDLYQVGIWREVTFSPPLNANTSRNMSFVVPTDIDGYPIETKHKPKKERQTLWYNNHRNIEFVAQQ